MGDLGKHVKIRRVREPIKAPTIVPVKAPVHEPVPVKR